MGSPEYLFQLMKHLFWGFGIALAYGIATSAAIWFVEPGEDFQKYLDAYFVSFNCLISGGLIVGTALFVLFSQHGIPSFIEGTFNAQSLHETSYYEQKAKYLSLRRSMTFSTDFIVVGFLIFFYCKFPLRGVSEYSMIFFACLQYALGVYVGRKLFYIGKMLNSVSNIKLTKDIFRDDALGYITSYVNVLSTLTIVFVYIHVTSYYNGPFKFNSVVGNSLRVALMLPAVIATPVLVIFNFYPRTVLRKLYRRSIDDEVRNLTEKLRDENLSEFERMSYIIQYDKLSKDELSDRLRLALSDLPIGITIIIMIIGLVIKH
jgi:hypothetical protein